MASPRLSEERGLLETFSFHVLFTVASLLGFQVIRGSECSDVVCCVISMEVYLLCERRAASRILPDASLRQLHAIAYTLAGLPSQNGKDRTCHVSCGGCPVEHVLRTQFTSRASVSRPVPPSVSCPSEDERGSRWGQRGLGHQSKGTDDSVMGAVSHTRQVLVDREVLGPHLTGPD